MVRSMLLTVRRAVMNVAFPLFVSRISPRFDFCHEILIVTIEEAKVVDRKTVSISSLTPYRKIIEPCSRDVKTLICSGTNDMFDRHLKDNGISLIYDVIGEADERLNQYLGGQLQPHTFREDR